MQIKISDKLLTLRKNIHQNPELSGKEIDTSQRILKFLSRYNPDEVITGIAGNGMAFIFEGRNPGKTILFRADLDALPIQEISDISYKSTTNGISHVCGHDGHMTILAGFGQVISKKETLKGKIILLFQPEEENGAGAKKVVEDKNFYSKIKPDYVFALHNVPGFPMHNIVIKNDVFCAASVGLNILLQGKSAHAANPETGISPANAVSKIIEEVHDLNENNSLFKDFSLATIININMGSKSFGTAPGSAEVSITLRTNLDEDMEKLKSKILTIVQGLSQKEQLTYQIEWIEEFKALSNNEHAANVIRKSAKDLNLTINELEEPFRWSEDFSWFTHNYKGAMFGLGSGVDQPALHNPDFDFPDELIQTGVEMFYTIYQNINTD